MAVKHKLLNALGNFSFFHYSGCGCFVTGVPNTAVRSELTVLGSVHMPQGGSPEAGDTSREQ